METHRNLLIVLGEWLESRRANRAGSLAEPGRLGRLLRWLTPNGGTVLLVVALIATAQMWAKPLVQPASAPSPSATTVNYQGRLANPDGTPVEDDRYGISFALYDAQEDGNLVWGPEDHPAVPVTDGLFSVGLGSRTSGGIPPTTWNGDRYLEITVAGETLEPRELIRSVPIAGMALTVPDGAIGSGQIAHAFGSSAMPLSNVIIQPWGSEIWSGGMEMGWGALDLTEQSSATASAVILHVYVNDADQDARLRLFYPGETTGSKMQTVFAQSNGMNSLLVIVPCDSQQRIAYRATADVDHVVIRLLGWIEPAGS